MPSLIQGRIVHIEWDQKAKPTPMLVLEQSNEGVNVTFRTTRAAGGIPANAEDSQLTAVKGGKGAKGATKSSTKTASKTSTKTGAKRPNSRK